ncbi:MAG: PEP-CTERM sorting domain-containing protein [Pirellulales bacterium]|nr:PEP-CTERM sorting domain-containing protein [Pirellulales bacterium]
MRNSIVVCVSVLFLSMGLVSVSHGELATDLLYKDGVTITHLEDDDWESFKEVGTPNGVVEVGEYFYGMFQIVDVRDAWPGTQGERPRQSEMFTGVFVAEVADINNSPIFIGGSRVYFQPAPASVWQELGLDAPADAGTMAVVYSDPDGPQGMVDPNAGAGVNDALATATNGTMLWEVGYTNNQNEFWYGDVNSLSVTNLMYLFYQSAVNVTATGAGTPLLPHGFLYPTKPTQVQFDGKLESFSAGHFMIRTDSDFYVRAVPEPSTLALAVFGALALAVGYWRRTR